MTAEHGHRVEIEDREELERTSRHEVALECLTAGLEAAHPECVVDAQLTVEDDVLTIRDLHGEATSYDLSSYDEILVVGGGNAAGHFARALEAETRLADRLTGGAVVTDDPAPTDLLEVLSGDHPFPSERGRESTRRMLEVAADAGEDDLVLACVTGGGSALMVAPAGSLTVEDLRSVTDALLRSGASIDEINAVRKHCSAIKGGGLAAAARPATVAGLVLSDVVGDDLGVVASGPISPDPTTYGEALVVLERYGIAGSDADVDIDAVVEHLRRGRRGEFAETPTVDDATFDTVTPQLLASSTTAIDAAATVARERGYDPLVLSSRIRGEAREAATVHVAIAEECLATGNPVSPPAVLLSGGETTVSVTGGGGVGGPNQEFALSAALELGDDGIVVASIDSDGIDGPTDAAGGIVDVSSVGSGSIDAEVAHTALEGHDAQAVLEAMGALVRTGPTGTNVNDLRVVVVDEG